MIHIVICDDEKHMSDHIRSMASDFFRKKNREISLQTFSGGEELLDYNGRIDILFLDIQMKDIDGMETARKLRADKFRGILVGNKLGNAKSMGIRASCSLLLPYPCGLRDIDICIVLSNALDNAIHACKSLDAGMEKYIQVSGRIQGDFLMMEVENSFHGKDAFKRGTPV